MKIQSIDIKDNNNYRAITVEDQRRKDNVMTMIVVAVLLLMSSILIKNMLRGGALYNYLTKPKFAPNFSVAFRILNILYVLLATSWALMLFRTKKKIKNKTKILFLINTIFSLLVPFIYFTIRFRIMGVILLSLHAIFTSYMITDNYKVKHVAGLLQIPYLLYLVFMTYILMYAKVIA